MSSNEKTGHAKNVANLLYLDEVLETYAAKYNPGNKAISRAAIKLLVSAALNNLNEVSLKLSNWKAATNLREIEFNKLIDFSERLLSQIQSHGVSPQTQADIAALLKRMKGKLTKADAGRVTNNATNGQTADTALPVAVKTHSTAKQSYDGRLELFGEIVTMVKGLTNFSPNEAEYDLPGLEARLSLLQNLNASVNTARAELKAARTYRNTAFYGENESLLNTTKLVKAYVRSLFGPKSQQYKTLKAIRFVQVVPAKNAR